MKKPCFRCDGDGFLPQFSHIKGGVCFTCGGDGEVETYPPRKTAEMSDKDYRAFVSFMTTEDLAGTDLSKLPEERKRIVMSHMQDKANRMTKSGLFSKGEKERIDSASFEELQKDILPSMQKKLVDSIPRPYEDSPYFKKGVISMVPTAWAMKFQGNRLRYDVEGELLESIVKNGMNEVPYFNIGQEDRHVKVGEGNHRMNTYNALGLDFIPMRVVRSKNGQENGSHAYDKMSRVPKYDYFKADASPDEVFDTYYDGPEFRDSVKSPEEEAKDAVVKLVEKYKDENFLSDADGEMLVAHLLAMDMNTHSREYYDGIEVLQVVEDENGKRYSKGTMLDMDEDGDDFGDDFDDDDI